MSVDSEYKLQRLSQLWPHGTVATSKWLYDIGVSDNLINRYKTSHWVKSIGYGAFIRIEDDLEWYGALNSLQSQLKLDLHVGGKTSLELQGLAHYLSLGQMKVDILKSSNFKVPRWFLNYPWNEKVRIIHTDFLPKNVGLIDKTIENISIKISSRERAALELLYLTPRLYAFDETPILMNSLASLRGDVLNDLLINCSSEKVKRLMLYFGDKQQHSWYKDIDQDALKIGQTPLKIVPNNSTYIAEYKILIPKDYIIENESKILY